MAGDKHPENSDPVDLEGVRRKYAVEAQKRFHPEGLSQFVDLKDADEKRLQDLALDPWADHEYLNAQDPPVKEGGLYKFFIVGAGFGGLQFAARLIDEGAATVDEIRIADAGAGFGGTWYWNRFPGLHCDQESYVYVPLLEETNYIPQAKYSRGEEIRLHAERIAEHWHLGDKTLFRADVQRVQWDEAAQLWNVSAVQGRGPKEAAIPIQFRAQYVYLAAGVLTKPKVPRIPGIHTFAGPIFHTSRWDYNLTGGSPALQELTKLEGKKVAIVGTAATSIGIIPEVAKFAGELYVFQRTPSYVKPRGQRPTEIPEFKTKVATKKGWQWERQLNFSAVLTESVKPGEPDLVSDGWTDMPSYSAHLGSAKYGILDPSPENIERHVTAFHAADLPHMNANRARVDAQVKDPETAAKLKPWYPSWCKRPTFSDIYYPTFNKPHVHLIDTDGKGVEGVTERGLVAAGHETPVDIIIFSTGYEPPAGDPSARTGIEIVGRNGRSLAEKWRTQGATTLHGYATSGFPNLFFSGTSQGTVAGSNIMMLAIIARHLVYIIQQADQKVGEGVRAVVEVTPEAEEAHSAEIALRSPFYAPVVGCTPGYFNGYGVGELPSSPEEKAKRARGTLWSEGTESFLKLLEKWRASGFLTGYTVTPVQDTVRASL